MDNWPKLSLPTECPKFYRKSVLHLLKYTANLHLSRISTDVRQIFGHSVVPSQTISLPGKLFLFQNRPVFIHMCVLSTKLSSRVPCLKRSYKVY